jgi:hypothetical protein
MFRGIPTLLSIAVLLPLARPAHAQDCGLNDNLTGEIGWTWCGEGATLHLPINPNHGDGFPGFTQSMLDLCWNDCRLENSRTLMVNWEEPRTSSACGVLSSRVTIIPLSATTTYWHGKVSMTYSRTWLEEKPTGEMVQVWRFLTNGDFYPTSDAGSQPCPVAPCSGSLSNPVRFTGYVDWALTCVWGTPGTWSNSWMMSHCCDQFEHMPGFPRAGASHPGRSYTFVGPSDGFIPTTALPAENGNSAQWDCSVRRTALGSTPGSFGLGWCKKREPAFHYVDSHDSPYCSCSPDLDATQFDKARMSILGSCGTYATSISPHAPLQEFHSMSIGEWTTVNVYPGLESVRWNVAGYSWKGPDDDFFHPELFFGVTTDLGYTARPLSINGIGDPIGKCFIDQANSIDRYGSTVGNLPFRSDLIINLNHKNFVE